MYLLTLLLAESHKGLTKDVGNLIMTSYQSAEGTPPPPPPSISRLLRPVHTKHDSYKDNAKDIVLKIALNVKE